VATFQGKKVSYPWWLCLVEYDQDRGGDLRLNSGKRTLAEQWRLYRNYRRTGWPVAAFPSPFAPHIRVGRVDHALDIDTNVGHGETGFQRWLERNGVSTHNPVRGEAWHLEVRNARQLKALAEKIRRQRDYDRRIARVRKAVIARARKGLKSPGQRRLLGRLRKASAKLRIRGRG
jgi:hypothetical protein